MADATEQTVPTGLTALMHPFRDAFTAPTWEYVLVLVMGAILVPGRRTVASALVSVCRRQALSSSGTRRLRRRARIEMNAIATKAMRCSFERSKIVFNRR